MFTFQKAINSEFVPVLQRSDGVEFSMEWMQDMKALGLDVEAEIQNPFATGAPFTKVADNGTLRFFDSNNKEVFLPKNGVTVSVPTNILETMKTVHPNETS